MEWSPTWLLCILTSATFVRTAVDLTTVPNAEGEDLVCTHPDSHILLYYFTIDSHSICRQILFGKG